MRVQDQRVVQLGLGVGLLLVIFATRLFAIDRFPIFIDETIHIYNQEQILETSPFFGSEIGRLGAVWWLFLFQPHSGDPIWIARVAVLLAVLPGIAATVSIGRLASGLGGMLLVGGFTLFSTYHYFFERLALADPVAGSLVFLAIFFGYRLRYRVHVLDAILCGGFLFLAIVAKVNVLPYVGIPLAAAIGFFPMRAVRRSSWLWFVVAMTSLLIPLFFLDQILLWTDNPWLSATLSYIESRSGSDVNSLVRVTENASDTVQMLIGYFHPMGFVVLLGGIFLAGIQKRGYLLLVFFAPMLPLWVGEPQETRYWIVPVALFGAISMIAYADLLWRKPMIIRGGLSFVLALLGVWIWLPFVLTASRSPVDLSLPEIDRNQYILSDAVGFGFEELPELIPQDALVLGLLANCQGLRYTYATRYDVRCTHINPNGEDIPRLLDWVEEHRSLSPYVILEESAYLPEQIEGEQMGVISRPGERASLTIYRVSLD